MDPRRSAESEQEYDVCLSFAGEQRDYVEQVASRLREEGIRVFYDDYEQVSLWGKDLYEHLDWVYRKAARYCVLFASADYARKIWTSHERRSAQARALHNNGTYILPARFDDTEIPGLRPTIAYVDLRQTTSAELAELILKKLNTGPRGLHFYTWPTAYSGKVWIQILPTAKTAGKNHEIKLRWGPWRRRIDEPVGEEGLTLTTSKAAEDSPAPCQVQVIPAARVLFGVGDSLSGEVLDIEVGWTYASDQSFE
jgi:TIR domain